MVEILRSGEVSGKTRVFCVLGHPIGHSLSPAMQNAALREMGLDGVYVAFDVEPENLPRAIHGLQALGIAGVNCTIPHKEALVPLMDELSEEAALIGAVNTLEFQGGRVIGHNTDAPGFLAAIQAQGFLPRGKRALVLGAGGSSRAIVTALCRSGAQVTLANRTVARAEQLAATITAQIAGSSVAVAPLEPEVPPAIVEAADLLVNTTSLGMEPKVDAMPPIAAAALHPGQFVYDLIYNPIETRLLRTARERGCRTSHGAGMLAHQGALALRIWTGAEAPAALMERVILGRLQGPSTRTAA